MSGWYQMFWAGLMVFGAAVAAADRLPEFVGSERCAGCHQPELEAWRGTHHDLAMQHVSDETVLGDFADAEFTYAGVTSTFFRSGDRFFVRTDGRDGKLADFEIRYTFGVSPLQQYLVEFPDGRIQALGIAWDSRAADAGGQRWFHLYPGEDVDSSHELHWTRPQQNWNHMCADCHSTNVSKGYDADQDRFQTTWSDIDVGCEACHGPGSSHVDWAAAASEVRDADPDKGLTIATTNLFRAGWARDPATGSARPDAAPRTGEIEICADCHSRRGSIAGAPERHARFLDSYMPAFLTEGLYYPDGQIHDEVFVWGSFLQSRMHQAGVTCSNCHDPHSLELRAPGDAVCSQCHAPAVFAVRAHHRHAEDGAGSSCVACHMPATTYMVVDARRDHSIRIPRPDLTVALGVPNACNRCHQDRSAGWAAEQVARWYPGSPRGQQSWARTFAAARAGDPRSEMGLVSVLDAKATPDIARATALLELGAFLSPRSGAALQRSLADASPLVRIAALRDLEALPPAQRYQFAAPLLSDPLRAVRVEAGRVLAAVAAGSLDAGARRVLQQAVAEYVEAQEINADRADARTNLGNLYLQQGDFARAEAEFLRAMVLDPLFPAAYVNLADLYRLQGRDAAAAEVLGRGLTRMPEAASLYYSMGLLRVRSGDRDAALAALQKAAELEPDSAHFAYAYAIALNSAGRPDAIKVLQASLERHPYDRDTLFALVTIFRDRGRPADARRWARRALEIRPDDAQVRALLDSLP
ncbi:MAG: tetratricopeptide repeat protein [Pseudomonadales bacterium]